MSVIEAARADTLLTLPVTSSISGAPRFSPVSGWITASSGGLTMVMSRPTSMPSSAPLSMVIEVPRALVTKASPATTGVARAAAISAASAIFVQFIVLIAGLITPFADPPGYRANWIRLSCCQVSSSRFG